MKTIPKDDGGIEQFNGREGETATLFVGLSFTFGGLSGGFAPRHLSRSAFLRSYENIRNYNAKIHLLNNSC